MNGRAKRPDRCQQPTTRIIHRKPFLHSSGRPQMEPDSGPKDGDNLSSGRKRFSRSEKSRSNHNRTHGSRESKVFCPVTVNVASVAGLIANPNRDAYAALKVGLLATTKALDCKWASRGIRVSA
ncbi:SDR family NAD(P)-dependent oxidoreductase [Rhizobium favelukesii]|uniref:SDR family NAD(P)-dependent oxidoreductase n=1 Tax=Rhizobium favelukesii TaxID=348824 RepID=UPI00313F065A